MGPEPAEPLEAAQPVSGSRPAEYTDGDRYAVGGQLYFPLPEHALDDYENDWGEYRSQTGEGHTGTDIFVEEGTPIYSVTDGVVTENKWLDIGGWIVGIETPRTVGPVAAGDNLHYVHMMEESFLEEGEEVRAGQLIGYAGDTGRGGSPHLHLGWYPEDESLAEEDGERNPFPLLEYIRHNGEPVGGDSGSSDDRGSYEEDDGIDPAEEREEYGDPGFVRPEADR